MTKTTDYFLVFFLPFHSNRTPISWANSYLEERQHFPFSLKAGCTRVTRVCPIGCKQRWHIELLASSFRGGAVVPSCWMKCGHESRARAALLDQTWRWCAEANTKAIKKEGASNHDTRNQPGPLVFDEKEKCILHLVYCSVTWVSLSPLKLTLISTAPLSLGDLCVRHEM